MLENISREFIVKLLTENQRITIFIRWFIQRHIIKDRCIETQCKEVAEYMTKKGYPISSKTIKHYYYKDIKQLT